MALGACLHSLEIQQTQQSSSTHYRHHHCCYCCRRVFFLFSSIWDWLVSSAFYSRILFSFRMKKHLAGLLIKLFSWIIRVTFVNCKWNAITAFNGLISLTVTVMMAMVMVVLYFLFFHSSFVLPLHAHSCIAVELYSKYNIECMQ